MALYLDEEEIWKCLKHPSKRRKIGICPVCLRERLAALCPDCANVRPCSCYASTSSSSSASSSFSRFSVTGDGVGAVGKVNNLIDREPPLRRSRSMAIPFLRSRSRFSGAGGDKELVPDRDSPAINGSKSARSFWSIFKAHKSNSNRGSESERDWEMKKVLTEEIDGDVSRKAAVMARSRSVAVTAVSAGDGEFRAAPRSKGKGWFFPSPMKVFRQSKASKVVQERSPLYRG
ncbi:hypothetical protein MtrunA17_Chr5g0411201 [Medicago truncatula]|uniref:DUF740 family protein n=1 Tax=Medicago truncatula TaxID=3880 RepID=G7KDT4_MEDTR|nr:uncharacterized protein LOC11430295 [Medicago truncatula]AES95851.1 DUF740 family protein [Medicago truncatula]KEH27709.1 DUF740 family protein [Medicago truncatula]RHN54836.1 hypothetical protein MtrunA17_Chr5g0411201 [Medicago truncatula]